MGLEETKKPRPFGEPREQCPIVARQPVIEGPVAHAFEGVEQPQGDHLTGPEVRLRMFGDGAQLLIDLKEQQQAQKLVLLVCKVLYAFDGMKHTNTIGY